MSQSHSYQPRVKRCWPFIVLLVSGICLNPSYAGAQQVSSMSKDVLTDERFAPGQVVSSGKNASAVGPLKVKTYRLEKVNLAKPFESIEADGTKRQVETAFRLTVTLDSPPNNDYFIWVDDIPWQAYPSGYETLNGENSISFLLYTPTLPFENGSSLAISTYSRKFELTALPEKLTVPLDVRAKLVADNARMQLKNIRSGVIISGKEARRVVWFTISSPFVFPVLDAAPTLEIWDKVLVGGAQGHEATFMMGADEFARLKDGAQIILRFPVGGVVGRLNKSMLDR
jgi:hypothetical protein